MKRKMCQESVRRTPDEHLSEKEMWFFLNSALDKKRAAKRKRPDMYREALLQRTVQRLNDEITERCMRKTKKRKGEEYEWRDGPKGWCMTNDMDEDEDDLLGINSFLSELSSAKSSKRKREEDGQKEKALLPSFKKTFGESKTRHLGLNPELPNRQRSPDESIVVASCRAGLYQTQKSLLDQFDSLCC